MRRWAGDGTRQSVLASLLFLYVHFVERAATTEARAPSVLSVTVQWWRFRGGGRCTPPQLRVPCASTSPPHKRRSACSRQSAPVGSAPDRQSCNTSRSARPARRNSTYLLSRMTSGGGRSVSSHRGRAHRRHRRAPRRGLHVPIAIIVTLLHPARPGAHTVSAFGPLAALV